MTSVSKSRRHLPSSELRLALLGSAVAFAAIAMAPSVSAQEIRVWSGYPELAPFYEHVAEGMKADHPDLSVKVEAIALREHEKRLALGLTSGEAAEVIELGTSTATRYLENGLFNAAPESVAAFVQDPANFNDFFRDSASYDGTVYGLPLFRGTRRVHFLRLCGRRDREQDTGGQSRRRIP